MGPHAEPWAAVVEEHPEERSTEALAPVLRGDHQLGGSVGPEGAISRKVARAGVAGVREDVDVSRMFAVEVEQGVFGERVDAVAVSSRAGEFGDGGGSGRGQRGGYGFECHPNTVKGPGEFIVET